MIIRYEKPEVFSVIETDLPKLRENDVLMYAPMLVAAETSNPCLSKVDACGVCGTDLHIHEGEFLAEVAYPYLSSDG